MVFRDRLDAGQRLADALQRYRDLPKTIVLGIPRGGVVVAAAIARALRLPLGICPVRKVGAPGNPELALGAVDDNDVLVFDRRLTRHLGIGDDELRLAAEHTREELRAWLEAMGPGAVPAVAEKTVILTDDGIATGYTAQAGIQSVRRRGAMEVILAAPVAPAETAEWLASQVDELVCLETPEPFYAVGNFFEEWPQVTDDEVRALLLARNTLSRPASDGKDDPPAPVTAV
ncbi:MAG TPA: phosphoribosyltransferase family protein [Candidatus Dormibacteraeota bacterium]|nr:phosphoribosyltransferase family protein [Candidatus Dormibacteraeota bacterium]